MASNEGGEDAEQDKKSHDLTGGDVCVLSEEFCVEFYRADQLERADD